MRKRMLGIVLMVAPRVDGRVVSTVGWDILELAGDAKEPEGWRRVKTPEGLQGWVSAHDIRSPIGYRASFVKSGGKWRLNALVAGD